MPKPLKIIVGVFVILLLCLGLVEIAQHAPLPSWATSLVTSTGPVQVLIVEETGDRNTLSPGQLAAITGTDANSLDAYAKTHCSKDAKGNPDFAVLDKDDDVSRAAPWVQSLWKFKPTTMPALLVARDGKVAYCGALTDDALAKVKKFGGP